MQFLVNPRVRLAIRSMFWLGTIFALVMLLVPHPPAVFSRVGDKIEHMAGFAGLALLGSFGFDHARRWLVAERLSFFGALIEVLQNIPALHRSCDITDWLADTAGIIVATAAAQAVISWTRLEGRTTG